MTRTEILALADRAEAGNGAETRPILERAWDILMWNKGATQTDAFKFGRKLDAEAYESAALMLVPDLGEIDGKRLDLHCFEKRAIARCFSDQDTDHKATAKTPALAIVAASLRAVAEGLNDD